MERKFKKAVPSADLGLSNKVLSERFTTALVEGKNKGDKELGHHLKVHQADEVDPKKLLKVAESLEKIMGKTSSVGSVATDDTENIEDRIAKQVIKSLSDMHLDHQPGVQAIAQGVNPRAVVQGTEGRMEELGNQLIEVARMFPTPVLFAINQDISARIVHTVTAVFDVGGKVILPVIAKRLPLFL